MQLISCHDGKLVRVAAADDDDAAALAPGGAGGRIVRTGLPALDALLPPAGLARGAVHEVLWDDRRGDPRPCLFAALLARTVAATASTDAPDDPAGGLRPIVWSDPAGELYPPALAAIGIPLARLFLLRPPTERDQEWAVAECLGCTGVGATIAQLGRLTRVGARRLQLAAERGGGAGIVLRPASVALAPAAEHAATTRWFARPAPGERTVQRWQIELIHGHGGQLNTPVYLEFSRDRHVFTAQPAHAAAAAARSPHADRVRPPDRLADGPNAAQARAV